MTIPPRQPDDPSLNPSPRYPYSRPDLQPPEYEPPLMRQQPRPGASPVVALMIAVAALLLLFGAASWWWFE